jgi:microcystin degradation protein MlrC
MKIGLGGFGHETITFWPGVTDLAAFERVALHGRDVIEKSRGTNTAMGGFVDILESEGVDMLPVCTVMGGATATVADAVYDFYVDRMTRTFAASASSLDGILLALHGAMATQSRRDPETDAVREIRRVVGPDMPIMVALDLHANKDSTLLAEATAVFGYHSSPHVDAGETGRRAARCMLRSLNGEIDPVTVWRKPGIVVPSVFSATTIPPGKDIIDRIEMWEKRPGVVDVTALFGFAWADVPPLGMSMIAVTDNDPDLARIIVDDLAELAHQNREALTGRKSGALFSVSEGVARAVEIARHAAAPVVILDHADRTGDTTFVLKALKDQIDQKHTKVAIPLFCDPEAAGACIETGTGRRIDLSVGAGTGWRDGGPVSIQGAVLWAGHGKYIGTGPMRKNQAIDLGPTAIVDSNGIWLQFVTYRASLIDEDPLIQFGYAPGDFDIIVTKSKTHFRAVYETLAAEIIIVDAPGQCPADLGEFNYRHVPPGVYPIDSP